MIRIFNTLSTTIYEWNRDLNAGADEILELTVRSSADWGKSTNQASRLLINPEWGTDSKYSFDSASLRLFAANVEGIGNRTSAQMKIDFHPLKDGFGEGTGRYFDNPVISDVPSLGTTWASRLPGVVGWSTPIPASGHQSSANDGKGGGGVWYSGSNSGSVTVDMNETGYAFEDSETWDVDVNITKYLPVPSNSVVPGNNKYGFIAKWTNESVADLPAIKFFSNRTNTIYAPRVEYKKDDYTWSTSKPTIGTGQATVYYKGNSGKYDKNSLIRFRPVVRETFPTASYETSSVADTIKTFSQGRACYAIVDVKTDEEFIRFDDTFTRISADSDGMYFDVYADSLYKGRLYKPVIRVQARVGADESYEYFDNKDYFEVV